MVRKKNQKNQKNQKKGQMPTLVPPPSTEPGDSGGAIATRHEDLSFLGGRIEEVKGEAGQIQNSFAAYDAEVALAIREIMEEAGVWEEVHNLELERKSARGQAEEKIRSLNTQLGDLQKVRLFLLGREKETGNGAAPDSGEPSEPSEPSEPDAMEASGGEDANADAPPEVVTPEDVTPEAVVEPPEVPAEKIASPGPSPTRRPRPRPPTF